MKIGYIISMVKRGIPAFTYREIDVLYRLGHEIAICPLTYKPGPYMPQPSWPVFRISAKGLLAANLWAMFSNPIRYFRLLRTAITHGTFREMAAGIFFADRLRGWGTEHIHCHFGDSKLYCGYFCASWLGLPMTVTLHAYEIHRNPNPAMFKIAAERCARVVVQSEFNKAMVMRNLGVPAERISLVRAHGDVRDPTPPSLRLLIVAEFREKKGHEILFSAVKKLGRKDIVVWVVGEGPVDVKRLADVHGVSDQTRFFGLVGKDMLNILYDSCDVFVLPSRTAADGDSEGIPAVLMEAMSRGKPVISTRHAGIPELVEEVLVDENDIDGLAEAISRLANDGELRDRLGARNTRIVESRFSDPAVAELADLYQVVAKLEVGSV